MIRFVNLMHLLVQVTKIMMFLRTRKKPLLNTQLFWCTQIKPFGKKGSLKALTVIFQRIPNIWNWYGLTQNKKIGFWLDFFSKNIDTKGSYKNSDIQGWSGYGEISVWYIIQSEKSETGIDNNRCKVYWRNLCCEVT